MRSCSDRHDILNNDGARGNINQCKSGEVVKSCMYAEENINKA